MPYGNGYGRENRRQEGRSSDERERSTPRGQDGTQARSKAVFAITERGERTFWTRIGIAYVNRDGSITVKLEAFPVSGNLQIREEEQRGERE